jgi:threonine aldolase
MKDLKSLVNNIPIHLDGARIWNAIYACRSTPQEIASYVDSLSVCLSKGLGAPIGSLLVGPADFIKKARRIRKALGGGMRQVGIVGAAGLQALDDFETGILLYDHIRTLNLARALKKYKSFKVHEVQTNIIFADIVVYDKSWNKDHVSSHINKLLTQKGVCISAWAPLLIRIVVHRDINDDDIEKTIQVFKEVDEYLLSTSV